MTKEEFIKKWFSERKDYSLVYCKENRRLMSKDLDKVIGRYNVSQLPGVDSSKVKPSDPQMVKESLIF